MITRAQKVRLGVFLVVSITILLVTLAVLLGVRFAAPRDTYFIRYTISLSGLEPGAPVKYHGVRVGRVENIKIDPTDVSAVIVTISLDSGTPVKRDTRAVVNLTGITGLKYVELTGGTKESEALPPGHFIEAGESVVDRLTGRAEEIALRIEALLIKIDDLLNDNTRARIQGAIEEAQKLIGNANIILEENRDNIRALTQALSEAVQTANTLLAHTDEEMTHLFRVAHSLAEDLRSSASGERIGNILGNVERITSGLRRAIERADLGGLGEDLKVLADRTRRLVEDLDVTILRSRENLYSSLSYIREAVENLSEFARSIREDPSLLLRGTKEREREMP